MLKLEYGGSWSFSHDDQHVEIVVREGDEQYRGEDMPRMFWYLTPDEVDKVVIRLLRHKAEVNGNN